MSVCLVICYFTFFLFQYTSSIYTFGSVAHRRQSIGIVSEARCDEFEVVLARLFVRPVTLILMTSMGSYSGCEQRNVTL